MGLWSEHGTSWYNCNRFEEKSGQEAQGCASQVSGLAGALPALLQPVCQSRAVGPPGQGHLPQDGEEDGAAAEGIGHVVDRGPIPQLGLPGSRRPAARP